MQPAHPSDSSPPSRRLSLARASWESTPRRVRDAVDKLLGALSAEAGDDLVGVVVHGSATRGEFVDGRSDVDLVVVLREGKRPTLERLAEPIALARAAVRAEVLVLLEGELARSADVFPLLYEEVRASHVLLAGDDPFAALSIAPEHVRLRVEQELRDLRVKLRRAVVDARGDGATLSAWVNRSTKLARSPLRALLSLLGAPPSPKLDAVMAAAGKRFRVDVSLLGRVREEPVRAHDALAALLDAAVEAADRFDAQGA